MKDLGLLFVGPYPSDNFLSHSSRQSSAFASIYSLAGSLDPFAGLGDLHRVPVINL